MRAALLLLACLILAAALAGCGKSSLPATGQPGAAGHQASPPPATASGLSLPALPQDGVQPWEKLDGAGRVARSTSSLPASSEAAHGADRFLESSSGVADNGEASSFVSGAAGAKQLSWAMYRLTLGGVQPGAVAADVNLHPQSGGAGNSQYYLAISDYASNAWQWHGPYTDGQITLSLASGNYLSTLGNTFIAIAAFDGAAFDVVDVLAAPRAGGDTTPPPAVPAAPVLIPQDGGLDMQWLDVVAGDLAGYRIYYSYSPFTAPTDNGVKSVPYLENTARFLLAAQPRLTYVALSAVDVTGNESALSPVASALPKPGSVPAVTLTVSAPSALLNGAVTLTAAGADSYDWDLDGDGVYDITGDATGSQSVDTTKTGIIRPRAVGHGDGNKAEALGSVSLIVSGNQRPVAVARVNVASGIVPLAVNFIGSDSTDPDGTIAKWEWDRTGDGIYERSSTTSSDTNGTFSAAGTYNARLRVTDDQGAIDVDTVTVNAQASTVTLQASPPSVNLGDAILLTVTANGANITDYSWDLDNNGTYEFDSGTTATVGVAATQPGFQGYTVKVTYSSGSPKTAGVTVLVHGWATASGLDGGGGARVSSLAVTPGGLGISYVSDASTLYYVSSPGLSGPWSAPVSPDPGLAGHVGYYSSLAVVNGFPAISYYDSTNAHLKFVRAADAAGTTWGAPITVDASIDATSIRSSLIEVYDTGGIPFPAIAYVDGTAFNLQYVRASDANGTSWPAPLTIDSSGTVAGFVSMANIFSLSATGGPAVAYSAGNYATYVRALDSLGASWHAPVAVDGADPTSSIEVSLAYVDGRPAIAYPDTASGYVRYSRALDATGDTWTVGGFVVDGNSGSGGAGVNVSLAVVNGIPMVAYDGFSSYHLYITRALDQDGINWGDPSTVALNETTTIGGISLIDTGGFPGISHFESFNGGLNFSAGY